MKDVLQSLGFEQNFIIGTPTRTAPAPMFEAILLSSGLLVQSIDGRIDALFMVYDLFTTTNLRVL